MRDIHFMLDRLVKNWQFSKPHILLNLYSRLIIYWIILFQNVQDSSYTSIAYAFYNLNIFNLKDTCFDSYMRIYSLSVKIISCYILFFILRNWLISKLSETGVISLYKCEWIDGVGITKCTYIGTYMYRVLVLLYNVACSTFQQLNLALKRNILAWGIYKASSSGFYF